MDVRPILVGLSLVACGGRALEQGGSAASAGQEAGGSTSLGGSSSGAGTSNAGGPSYGGAPAVTHCIGDAVPASPVTFQFESNQRLWLRRGCSLEFTLTRLCQEKLPPITMHGGDCSQECGAASNNGCFTCGACPSAPAEIGPSRVVTSEWDGYDYANGISISGCNCYTRSPVVSGRHRLEVTAFFSSDDAIANRNGYTFSMVFMYPTSDIVHVPLDFIGL